MSSRRSPSPVSDPPYRCVCGQMVTPFTTESQYHHRSCHPPVQTTQVHSQKQKALPQPARVINYCWCGRDDSVTHMHSQGELDRQFDSEYRDT
ncbi:hypothetical protein BC936DRAFT_139830 [Jimgerdemannia flammicorona]|uniref:Uncharacterized protein n=1 Tax=Jimgerdemannia flammicorona TaxID=994334 RepID=A0A433B945_9FUNG|nr:hypothetical protein BC936DRAFT_139830 [Jimgerdemannia flammicorona]